MFSIKIMLQWEKLSVHRPFMWGNQSTQSRISNAVSYRPSRLILMSDTRLILPEDNITNPTTHLEHALPLTSQVNDVRGAGEPSDLRTPLTRTVGKVCTCRDPPDLTTFALSGSCQRTYFSEGDSDSQCILEDTV